MNKIIGLKDEYHTLLKCFQNNSLPQSILLAGTKGIGKRFFIITLIKEFIKLKFNNNHLNHHLSLRKVKIILQAFHLSD